MNEHTVDYSLTVIIKGIVMLEVLLVLVAMAVLIVPVPVAPVEMDVPAVPVTMAVLDVLVVTGSSPSRANIVTTTAMTVLTATDPNKKR